ncbi:hypothetical protein JIQ42_06697 [Leishmania sp. Namibia]|uniref:hypothetical protein n=1 Tax=Leishmania sp. Namibia TaxID=2802991 RepID=UPI001B5F9316|nr:hypothetical protein JIQ42_06697 [Leishmania sp. Namibia]
MGSVAESVAPASAPAALEPELMPSAMTKATENAASTEVTPAPAPAEIQIHTPHQVEHSTPRHPNSHATAAAKTNGYSHRTPSTSGLAVVTSGKTVKNGATGAWKVDAPSKVRGRPFKILRRTPAELPDVRKDLSPPPPAAGAVSAQPESRASKAEAAAERAKSSHRMLESATGDLKGNGNGSAAKNGRASGQRRTRFVDPSASANGATETTTAAPQRPRRRRMSPLPLRQRKVAPPTVPPAANGAPTAACNAALYTHSIPQHCQPNGTPQRASATVQNARNEPHQRHCIVDAEAPCAAAKIGALEPVLVPAPAPTMDVSIEFSASPPSHSPTTSGSPQPQFPSDAPDEDSKVRDDRDDGVALDAVDVPAPVASPSTSETAAATTGVTAAAEKEKASAASAETHRDSKHIVISRPSVNLRVMRMTDLARPSEAQKLALHPAQGSSLIRRSRQPRKALNVFLTKYPLIRKMAEEMGFDIETTEDELNDYRFNLCWSDTVLSLMRLVRLSNWQRTNHFPSMYLLCRKGHLGTTLGKLRRKLPSHFAYYPRTWSMRSERMQFTQYMTAVRQRRVLKYFILKPNSGCQGRGIIVARDPLTALDDHTLDSYIVQEYVHRPLLLEGKKFDLRVYVLLTSIRHPSIFLFNDGLVRICTEPYEIPNEENVKQACKHLTNYAVNKKSSDFVFNTDVEHMDVGNKRNFGFLNRWLADGGHSPDLFWDEVGFIVVKTILAAQPIIAKVYDSCFPTGFNEGYCCFEVLGFDILIDNKMKPWLIEVNHTPSFATETPLDFDIKSKLISEVWSIIDCKATDYEKDRQRERDEFARRNMPPWASNHPLYGNQLRRNTSRSAGADELDSSLEHSPLSAGHMNAEEEIPSYVHARRKFEDTKLKNFKRIYPSPNPDMQLVYDTIQSLATLESANSRLYYNSTVAAPMLPPTSPPPPSARANAVVPHRARPPSLGPLPTTSRINGSNGSPNTLQPQRTAAAPITSSAPATASVATIATPIDAVPTTILVTSGHAFTSPSTVANSASAPIASSATPTPSTGREGRSSAASTYRLMEDMLRRRRRSSDARSSAPAPSYTATTRSSASPSDSGATTTSTPAAAKPVRVYTPRPSPIHTAKNPSAVPSPFASQRANVKETGADSAAANGSKPRSAEMHGRASESTVAMITATPADASAKDGKSVADETAAPASAAPQKKTPVKTNKSDAGAAATSNGRQASQQNGAAAAPTPDLVAPHPVVNGSLRVSSRSSLGQKLPTPSPDETPNRPGVPGASSRKLSPVKRKSSSLSNSMRDLDLSGAVHSRQRSKDRETHSMLTHPEPTEEELARLATLQAMLDYEAAADPQPNDDDDDDYNLTE